MQRAEQGKKVEMRIEIQNSISEENAEMQYSTNSQNVALRSIDFTSV